MTQTPDQIIAQDTENLERQLRQTCRAAAVELSAQLQLVEGLGITVMEEVKEGQAIEEELAEKFLKSLDSLRATFLEICPPDKE
jgi:predicted signal transduction protein with EAL and GGDEF domain